MSSSAARRARRRDDRLRGVELERVRARARAVLTAAHGTAIPAPPGSVVLLADEAEPVVLDWRRARRSWLAAGIMLHADTVARVEQLLASGTTPTVVCVGEWLDVVGDAVRPLARGGVA